MSELETIRKLLLELDVCQNGYIKVEDVRNVVAFIDGLMFVKDNEDETKRS